MFDGTKITAAGILEVFEQVPDKEFVNVDHEKKRVMIYRSDIMHGSTEDKIKAIEKILEKRFGSKSLR